MEKIANENTLQREDTPPLSDVLASDLSASSGLPNDLVELVHRIDDGETSQPLRGGSGAGRLQTP
jgi:hypothetical protein